MTNLLSYEITSSSFFLTTDGYMKKAAKSELVREIRVGEVSVQKVNESAAKYSKYVKVIDFMEYARRLNTRMTKCNLKTFGDAMKNLWDTFWSLSLQCDRIDIVFDLYKPSSVKASERTQSIWRSFKKNN